MLKIKQKPLVTQPPPVMSCNNLNLNNKSQQFFNEIVKKTNKVEDKSSTNLGKEIGKGELIDLSG